MVRRSSMCGLATALIAALVALPSVTAQTTPPDQGILDIFSAIYVDWRSTGCAGFHLKTDFVYLKPKLENENLTAWSEIISGSNLIGNGMDGGYNIRTGDEVRVRYKTTNSTNRRLLSDAPAFLEGFDIVTPGEPKEVWNGEPIIVKSHIYIITTCGMPAATTVEKVRNTFFTGSQTISEYHNLCSYGKVFFKEEDTRIFEPISVPCSGTVNSGVLNYNYNGATSCGAAEQYAWRMAGEAAARAAGYSESMDTGVRRRIITILPNAVKCGWAGLGSVGCSGRSCSVYIKGAYANDLTIHMHELGHTQGLSHAGRGLDEYGDKTDIMGNDGGAEGYLCMNPGNQLRVGWNTAIATLTPSTLAVETNVGVPGRWQLPAVATTSRNHLWLRWNGVGGISFPNAFISFRTRGSRFDNILAWDMENRVGVHMFNGSAADRDFNRTLLVAVLATGGVYISPFVDTGGQTDRGGGWKLTVLSINSGVSATVQLCKMRFRTDCAGTISTEPSPRPSISSPPPRPPPPRPPPPRRPPPPPPSSRPPPPRPPPPRPPPRPPPPTGAQKEKPPSPRPPNPRPPPRPPPGRSPPPRPPPQPRPPPRPPPRV